MAGHQNTVGVMQRPGDVVYISPLIYHSVLLGYVQDTPALERWSMIDVYVRHDKLASCVYATQGRTGRRKVIPKRGSDFGGILGAGRLQT
jgi:hypothetical protein